jgi:hypothetical protein
MWVTVVLKTNHGPIRLKRFVSRFPNCAISFFHLHLVLHACVQTFDVMGEPKKNLGNNQA